MPSVSAMTFGDNSDNGDNITLGISGHEEKFMGKKKASTSARSASRCYADLAAALREDMPNTHDCGAAANAIDRLEVFRIGSLRALQDRNRIIYGWNMMEYGYFVRDEIGVARWAGKDIEGAVMKLGLCSA